MAQNGKGRGPLVADRRTPRAQARKPAKGRAARSTAKPAVKAPAKARRAKAATPRRGRGRRPPRGPLGWLLALPGRLLRLLWAITWRVSLLPLMIVLGAIGLEYSNLPDDPAALYDTRVRGSVTLLDRDGKVFAFRGDQYRQVSAGSVSPFLRDAVIATEDRRFYRHLGVSPRGIVGAMAINLREGRRALSGNGGSTITQQVAKLLCMGERFDPAKWKDEAAYEADCRQSSLWRKAREAVYAVAMEVKYSKDEVLTIYLNRAYLGNGARGFEAASQVYFGKPSAQVTPAEAAMLAGLLTAPSRFAPTANLARSQGRAGVVIGLMRAQGYLTAAQADEALTHPATLSARAREQAGGYFADWAMSQGPDFLTRDTTEDVEILTTFDPRIQRAAEAALAEVFETKVKAGSEAEAAIIVMSADGAVRAMVGGRGKNTGGLFNRAVQARRQTGSSFKPFVYATALDLGYSPYDTVVDEPVTIPVKGSKPWSPQNYDRKFRGRVTLAQALAQSLNVPTVKVAQVAGLENVRKVAAQFGIDSDLALGPALALGVSESTLVEMTGAYAGILNGGTSVRPFAIRELRLKGDETPLMGQEGGLGKRVIQERADRELVWMLSRVIEEGTGTRARLSGRPAAGKTGTTQAARDAWFVGFTADYVAGVWLGYDDNRPLTGVTGGGLPADIWRETMERVHEGLPVHPLPMTAPEHLAIAAGNVPPGLEPGADGFSPIAIPGGGDADAALGGAGGLGGLGGVLEGDAQAESILQEVLRDLLGQ